jgi:hypothetical protein
VLVSTLRRHWAAGHAVCWSFLHRWFDCLATVTATLTCCRCLELGLLQTCDIWWQYDFLVGGWAEFRDCCLQHQSKEK